MLFRKAKSKFYWYDFTVRGCRYRGSTQETRTDRASKVAGLKLARVLEGGDQFPNKHTSLAELAQRFLVWLEEARLEAQTKKYYCNGWRLLKL
jgi:hypothetical protein